MMLGLPHKVDLLVHEQMGETYLFEARMVMSPHPGRGIVWSWLAADY